ncbi:MAG: carboxypeptidase-like regulatory domain-containing protein [Candidatus Neomarinimicrobiota bacterium]
MRIRSANDVMASPLPMLLCIFLICVSACNVKEELEELVVTLAGNVSHEGEPVSGVLTLLVEGTDVSDGLDLANASVSDSNGDYLIIGVKPGDYYVLAVDDTDDNFEFDSDSDRLGFYGIDPNTEDSQPDKITVSDQDVSGADIVYLYTLP